MISCELLRVQGIKLWIMLCSVVSIETVSFIGKQSSMNALELIEYNLDSLKGLSNTQYKMEWVNLSTTIGCKLFE